MSNIFQSFKNEVEAGKKTIETAAKVAQFVQWLRYQPKEVKDRVKMIANLFASLPKSQISELRDSIIEEHQLDAAWKQLALAVNSTPDLSEDVTSGQLCLFKEFEPDGQLNLISMAESSERKKPDPQKVEVAKKVQDKIKSEKAKKTEPKKDDKKTSSLSDAIKSNGRLSKPSKASENPKGSDKKESGKKDVAKKSDESEVIDITIKRGDKTATATAKLPAASN